MSIDLENLGSWIGSILCRCRNQTFVHICLQDTPILSVLSQLKTKTKEENCPWQLLCRVHLWNHEIKRILNYKLQSTVSASNPECSRVILQDLDHRLQNLNRIRHRILISPGHALPLVSGKTTSPDDPYVIWLHDISESGLQYRRSSLKCKAYSYTDPGACIIGSILQHC